MEYNKDIETKNQEQLWQDLAKKDAFYHIKTQLGQKPSEESFHQSGVEDIAEYVDNDNILIALLDGAKSKKRTKELCILDLGCGAGRLSKPLLKYGNVYGVDISEEMVVKAQSRVPEAEFKKGDGIKIPYRQNTFDFVFSYISTFYHAPSKQFIIDALKEVFRVTKKDGIIKLDIRGNATQEPTKDMWWYGMFMTEDEIIDLCKECNVEILRLERHPVYEAHMWLTAIVH
jgi:ubiquinone/menaquinone biosynthesis C-methylase UbiE